MCGILVYKHKGNNNHIRHRGEVTSVSKIRDLTFIHNLLPITGKYTEQPFIDGDIACVYNGEIYNHNFKRTDGENIIPLYKEYGINFVNQLDGEYAIALYDFKNDLALFITDPFSTKPLWINGIECASYESGVGGKQVNPNTILGIKISTGDVIINHKYHKWDWNQYKDNYNDWIKAFKNAVKKRAVHNCFLGLSSGYDSGAISRELADQRIRFKAYSILNNENEDIIKERSKYCYEWEEIRPNQEARNMLKTRIERVPYKVAREDTVLDDTASLGLADICYKANREGKKVYLSGQGADEIIGDYKLYPKQSNFKGKFPKNLKEWDNFTNGIQRDYINKEEYVGGAFSIETRYPFLDKDVVQEFLWLKPELKNKEYKAPIFEYLTINKVPFEKDIKKGLRPL